MGTGLWAHPGPSPQHGICQIVRVSVSVAGPTRIRIWKTVVESGRCVSRDIGQPTSRPAAPQPYTPAMPRVHITGASGAGTTTLGVHLALALRLPHHDTDDFFWRPDAPLYSAKRPIPDRLRLMEELFLPREGWVLSGSLMGWGDRLIERFTHVIFLTCDPAARLARLKRREGQAYGSRIEDGGDMAATHAGFMAWAEGYDSPDFPGRSRARHEAWLSALPCPVIRLDSTQPLDRVLAAAETELKAE